MGKLAQRSAVASASWRGAIVAALGAVTGVVAGPNVPDVPTPGAAWPVYVQTTGDGVLAFPFGREAWDVYVLLPAGYSTATVEAADALRAEIVTALWPVGRVSLVEPVSVRFENQTAMPGFRVRLVTKGNSE